MKNKRMLYIIFICLIVLIISIIIFNKNHKSGTKNKNFGKVYLSEKIVDKMNNKEKFLVYLFSSDEYQCYLCKDTNKIIKLYEELYDLKFIRFDLKTEGEKDYNDLLEKLNIKKEDVSLPSVIFIDDGYYNALLNEVVYDNDLREYLNRYKFIKTNENEKIISTADEFNNVYNEKNNQILLIYESSLNGISMREKLFSYSLKYNFPYYYIQYGLGDTISFYEQLKTQVKEELNVPSILITNNGKIIDYVDVNNNVKIEAFLRKNNIIS